MTTSKEMPPLPSGRGFTSVFIHNQFRTKIELPTRPKFSSLNGKVAIVTGSNSGLGFEASRQLLSLGLSHLIIAVRSLERGEVAAGKLRSMYTSATIDVWALDQASYPSIQSFVQKCDRELSRTDITILNAGLSSQKFVTTKETGHEVAVQVNHYGSALLTVLLLPVLSAKSTEQNPARVTIVNSVMSHLCTFSNRDQNPLLPSFDDAKTFDGNDRYGVSKLLNQLFVVELTERVKAGRVIVNMVDPALTKGTELFREAKGALRGVAKGLMAIVGRAVDQGAATYVYAVLSGGKETHGCFLMNTKVAPLAAIYYAPEGKNISKLIWEETMKELSFAGVEDIVASMK